MFYYTTYPTPVGLVTMSCDESYHLVGLWLEGQKYFGSTILKDLVYHDDLDIFHQTKGWLDRYFKGEKPSIKELPLKPIGSPFRQAVWNILCEIPYGQTLSYGEIARKLAQDHNKTTMSAQAVGGAVGHNPLTIIIPCHRVMGTGGNLTGFAGGLDRKIQLLEHEGVDLTHAKRPTKGSAL